MSARTRTVTSKPLPTLAGDHPFRAVLRIEQDRLSRLRRTRFGALDPIHAAHRAFRQDPDAFAALLREHGVRPPRRGVSSFLPLLHLFFGAGKSPRSKSRYARVLEFAEANQIHDIGAYVRRAGGVDAILARVAETREPRRHASAPQPNRTGVETGVPGLTLAATALGLLHQIDVAQAQARTIEAPQPDADDSFHFATTCAVADAAAPQANGDAEDHFSPVGLAATTPARLLAQAAAGDIDIAGQGGPDAVSFSLDPIS